MNKSEKLYKYTKYLIDKKKQDNSYPTIEMIEAFSEWLDENLTQGEKSLVGIQEKAALLKRVG